MLGWKELALKVDALYTDLPNVTETLVLCDNYGQAGAINYYTKAGIKATSFNADYMDWFNLDQKYTHIRIKNYEEKDDKFKKPSPYFDAAVIADSITNPYARQFKVRIFVFTGVKIDINQRIKNEIEEVKNYCYMLCKVLFSKPATSEPYYKIVSERITIFTNIN